MRQADERARMPRLKSPTLRDKRHDLEPWMFEQEVEHDCSRLTTPQEAACVLINLGKIALARGDIDQAAAYYEASLALWREHGEAMSVTGCSRGLAIGAIAIGTFKEADRLLGAAEALRERITLVNRPSPLPRRPAGRRYRRDRDRSASGRGGWRRPRRAAGAWRPSPRGCRS